MSGQKSQERTELSSALVTSGKERVSGSPISSKKGCKGSLVLSQDHRLLSPTTQKIGERTELWLGRKTW